MSHLSSEGMRFERLTTVVLLCACSAGEAGNDTFFTGGSLGSSATTPGDEPDGDTEEDDDDGGDSSTSGDAADSDGPTGPATSGGPPDETGAMEETGASAEDGSTSGPFMPGNGQPMSGMYAHCYEPDVSACTADAPLCLMMDSLMEGFCTHAECSLPSDCDPAPLDATATPFCFEGEDPGGMPVGLCALDCGSGKTCPPGMQCVMNVSSGPDFPQHDICI